MGGGVSALGAVALGCMGAGAGGIQPHRNKRFLTHGLPCPALCHAHSIVSQLDSVTACSVIE